MKMHLVILFLLTLVCPLLIQSEDILMLLPFGSQSHKILFSPLASALAKRGHHVTIVSQFKPSSVVENVKEIWSLDYYELYKTQTKLIVDWGKNLLNTKEIFLEYERNQNKMCDIFYNTSEVQSLLKEAKSLEKMSKKKKFDIVFLDAAMNEQVAALGDLLGDSIILVNSATLFQWVSSPLNIPFPLSFVPLKMFDGTSEMTFVDRTKNFLLSVMLGTVFRFVTEPFIQEHVEKIIPNARKIADITKDSAVVFVNADPVLDEPRPGMPNVINVGGIHCREAKSLSKELNEFIGNSKFVIFSLGSIFDEKFMTKHAEEEFLKAFSQLPYKIIWKYNRKITEKIPPNVKILNWLPQQDLLGHSQSCAFITHSGLLSMQEAVYHGVPMVSFPLFAEQPGNAALAKARNLTTVLNMDNVTSDDIVSATIKACEDPIMQKSAKKHSILFKDRPNNPLDLAVYWTEYVIRHPRVMHLRNPAQYLRFFEYFSIDVILFICLNLVVLMCALKGIFCLIRRLR